MISLVSISKHSFLAGTRPVARKERHTCSHYTHSRSPLIASPLTEDITSRPMKVNAAAILQVTKAAVMAEVTPLLQEKMEIPHRLPPTVSLLAAHLTFCSHIHVCKERRSGS